MREDALACRHHAEQEILAAMLEKKRVSPRSYNVKRLELEKWIIKEKKDIKRYKKNAERGIICTSDSIKRTQRDLNFMRKMFGKYGTSMNKSMNRRFNILDNQ